MAIKYNKNRDIFELSDYTKLTNADLIKGIDEISSIKAKLKKLEKEKNDIKHNLKRVEAEIKDSSNYLELLNEVTSVYNGIPVNESITLPDQDSDSQYGSYHMSTINGNYNERKVLRAWVNQHLPRNLIYNSPYIWCFELRNYPNDSSTFLARNDNYESNDGFTIDVVKLIAEEFVTKGVTTTEIRNNIPIYTRESKLNKLLNEH